MHGLEIKQDPYPLVEFYQWEDPAIFYPLEFKEDLEAEKRIFPS